MAAQKKHIGCELEIELIEQLQHQAQQTGRTRADVVREALEQWITTPAPSTPAQPQAPSSELALNTETLLAQITTALQTQLTTFATHLPAAPETDTHAIRSELEYLSDRIANLESLVQQLLHPPAEPAPPLTPTPPRSIAATVLEFPEPAPEQPPALPEPPDPNPSEGLTLAELYEQTFLNPEIIQPMADYLEMTEVEFIEMRTGWRYDYLAERWYLRLSASKF